MIATSLPPFCSAAGFKARDHVRGIRLPGKTKFPLPDPKTGKLRGSRCPEDRLSIRAPLDGFSNSHPFPWPAAHGAINLPFHLCDCSAIHASKFQALAAVPSRVSDDGQSLIEQIWRSAALHRFASRAGFHRR